jgi:hypothetical protein
LVGRSVVAGGLALALAALASAQASGRYARRRRVDAPLRVLASSDPTGEQYEAAMRTLQRESAARRSISHP